jgi:hypothetical protein
MGRKGQSCVLEVIGRKMNSVQVRFEDGHGAITSANALKTHKPTTEQRLF